MNLAGRIAKFHRASAHPRDPARRRPAADGTKGSSALSKNFSISESVACGAALIPELECL